jgi:hypothetical protein
MIEPYSHVIIKLLQDVVYNDELKTWNDLLTFRHQITDYFSKIGIDCIIDENDGYSYLLQPEATIDDDNKLPRLVRKQALSYEVTLTAVLLREWLEEFDSRLELTKPFLLHKEIKERASMFFQDKTNKTKFLKNLDNSIEALERLKILRINRHEDNKDNIQYEIKRIIKALISNEKLSEILAKIKEDAESV